MFDAARQIEAFSRGKEMADYAKDRMLRSAIERQFEIIGEAMTRLIKRDEAAARQINEYRKIAGFRNALIHGYDSVDDSISWGIVQNKVPILLADVLRLCPDIETA